MYQFDPVTGGLVPIDLGAVADTRLSSNVPLLSSVNTFSAKQLFSTTAVNPSSISNLVSWIRADDIAGADGTAITSITISGGTSSGFSGTGTLRTGANGINGRNALSFNGSSNLFASTTGGASLTTNWYIGCVVRWNSLTGYQSLLSWGDAGITGKRRTLFKWNTGTHPDNDISFIGEGADSFSSTAPTVATNYYIEAKMSSGTLTLYLNGVLILTATPSLVSYTSTALELGVNPGLGEFFNGLMSEAFFYGAALSTSDQQSLRDYVTSRYGIRMLLTGGTDVAFTNAPGVAVSGSLAAMAVGSEHMLVNDWSGQNVVSIWNRNTGGFSVMRCLYPTDGAEIAAFGSGVGIAPWGSTNGCAFIECSNFHDKSLYGEFRLVQTGYNAGVNSLRFEVLQNGDMQWYKRANGTGAVALKLTDTDSSLTITGLLTANGGLTLGSTQALTLGASAITGLTPGVLAATTNATLVLTDASGQAYRIPCII